MSSTLTSISHRMGDIQSSYEQARQLSHSGLMAPSVKQGWQTVMGTGCTSKVPSAPLTPLHLLWVCYGSCHSNLAQFLCFGSAPTILLPFLQVLHPLRVWIVYTTMPRERDKPKRGPSYYNFTTRKRRLHHFSQALLTSLVHQDRGTEEPPMAIVEEEIPAESIIIPSDLPSVHCSRPP
jgi:hypothetical protein